MDYNSLHIVDYIIIILSLIIMIGVGLRFSKKQNSTSQFSFIIHNHSFYNFIIVNKLLWRFI